MADQKKIACDNRKARHDYFIDEIYEAGIVLQGTEVKSLRLGRANLQDSYAAVEKGEVFLYNMHISPYEQGNRFNHDPKRTRKLLLHKREINKLIGATQQKGFTIVPLKVYFTHGKAKVEIALARGKHKYDKRQTIADRDAKRRVDKVMKERNYS